MGSAVNIEANGRAIGMKRSGMTLLPGPSVIYNWFGLLLQLATTDLWTWIWLVFSLPSDALLYLIYRRCWAILARYSFREAKLLFRTIFTFVFYRCGKYKEKSGENKQNLRYEPLDVGLIFFSFVCVTIEMYLYSSRAKKLCAEMWLVLWYAAEGIGLTVALDAIFSCAYYRLSVEK